jgi:hypothetical protein
MRVLCVIYSASGFNNHNATIQVVDLFVQIASNPMERLAHLVKFLIDAITEPTEDRAE